MNIIAGRLSPGQDLLTGINSLASHVSAGAIVSMVGSLKIACLRLADRKEGDTFQGPFELVSGSGTVGAGSWHIHIVVADKTGKTLAGHLLPGCEVYTTAEIVLLDISDKWRFERKLCEKSGYLELHPTQANDV